MRRSQIPKIIAIVHPLTPGTIIVAPMIPPFSTMFHKPLILQSLLYFYFLKCYDIYIYDARKDINDTKIDFQGDL